jgi:hypothetical protein
MCNSDGDESQLRTIAAKGRYVDGLRCAVSAALPCRQDDRRREEVGEVQGGDRGGDQGDERRPGHLPEQLVEDPEVRGKTTTRRLRTRITGTNKQPTKRALLPVVKRSVGPAEGRQG